MIAISFSILSVVVFVTSAAARVDAIYSVPTVTPALAGSASYPTRSDQNTYGSPEHSGLLSFFLPPELTGIDTDFQLKRQLDGSWAGSGTDGSKVDGTCSRGDSGEDAKWFTCNVKFNGLVFDAKAREITLEKIFGRGFEFGQRSEVARQFEGQPIGVIKVRIRRD